MAEESNYLMTIEILEKCALFSRCWCFSPAVNIALPLLFCTLQTGDIMAALATVVGRKDATTAGGKTNGGGKAGIQ
jgi:hypothetical protein